jgi:hypothetical protein
MPRTLDSLMLLLPFLLLGFSAARADEPAVKPTFNYAEALQKAIYFYDCQRSGNLSLRY